MKSNVNYEYFLSHPNIPDPELWVSGINNRLKVIRKGWGLTQAQFAELLGLPRQTYNLIEIGKTKVSVQIVKLVYFQFYANLNYLLFNEERDEPVVNFDAEIPGNLPNNIYALNPTAREHAIALIQNIEAIFADLRAMESELEYKKNT